MPVRRFLPLILPLAALSASALDQTHDTTPIHHFEPEMTTGFIFDTVRVNNTPRHFAVYVPRDYTAEREWPVIVFLNGSGECGVDGQKQLCAGLAPAIVMDAGAYPFICVFPQKPDQESTWLEHETLVLAALDQTLAAYRTDRTRVYLTGLSQGGRGTWEIAAKHPARFAAIAPICGWGDPGTLAPALTSIPIWAFHGEKDNVVLPKGTRELVGAIEKLGATPPPRMTIYPEANHNSWDRAYRTEKLGEWFLEHKKVPSGGN